MSGGFISPVALVSVSADQLNFSNGVQPVSVQNIDASSNQLLYTADGVNITGLNLGAGLSTDGTTLTTVGNPSIGLTSNSLYVNDGVNSIQSGVDASNQADTVFISSGSFGETPVINNKYNISLTNLGSNGGTICEILNGLSITGTSELIRLNNITIKGSSCVIRGVGRHRFTNCSFIGSAITPLNITIGQTVSQFMTFLDCEFNQYCNITIHPTFANVLYFINCNFQSASITCSQSLPQQVIFNNCSGLDNLAGSNFTKVGLTVTGTDINVNQTNSYIASSLNLASGSKIYLNNDDGGVGNVIQSNGESGLIWAPSGGFNSYWNVFYDNGQQTVKPNAGSIILYQRNDQFNIIPNLRMLFKCLFNFSVTNANPLLTLSLVRIQGVVETTLQTFTQSLSRNGHHSQPINFDWTMDGDYSLSFKVVASVSVGNISTDVNDYYSVTVDELRASP